MIVCDFLLHQMTKESLKNLPQIFRVLKRKNVLKENLEKKTWKIEASL